MKYKKYMNQGVELAKTGIAMGVLSSVDSSGATGNMAKALPVVGTLVGARMVVDATKSLLPKKK
jgi:hypothetical protein